MEIILIANGLTGYGEHSYRLIREVSRALSNRNMRHRVYAAKSLDPLVAAENIARRHFKYSLYHHIGRIFPRSRSPMKKWFGTDKFAEFFTWRILNRSFRNDLESLAKDGCTADDLLVVTAISQNQLSGLIDFLLGRPPHLQPRVVCQLMFTPTWTAWNVPAQLGEAYYRMAFSKAAPLIPHKLFFAAENEAMARSYREMYGINVMFLPVAIGAAQPQRRSTKSIRLGFFGYSKREKGFQLLPEIAALCDKKGIGVTFTVQIQHSGWEPETIAAERALRCLENVRLIEGTLRQEDYTAETSEIDITLLPYDPFLFGMRGSGVFTEAIAAGRPIIASDGTFAADSIKNGVAEGEVFAPYSAEACVEAIIRLLPRLSEFRARAVAKAEAFARAHDADAYADALLALVTNETFS